MVYSSSWDFVEGVEETVGYNNKTNSDEKGVVERYNQRPAALQESKAFGMHYSEVAHVLVAYTLVS